MRDDEASRSRVVRVEVQLGQLLRLLQQRQSRVLDLGQRYGLTRPQYSVLAAIVGLPGIDQRTVTTTTFIDKSTVADVVNRLAERNLLVVSRNPLDRRRGNLLPSRAAIALLYESVLDVVWGNEQVLSTIPREDLEKFLLQLQTVSYAGRSEAPSKYVIPSPDGVRPPLVIDWGLGRLLRGCLQRHGRLWTRHVSTVTHVQYLALRALAGCSDIDQRLLGELISLDKASLTIMLDRLLRQDLVFKTRDPADGRRRLLVLTNDGNQAIQKVADQVRQVEREFLAPLTPEQHLSLVSRLRRLVTATDIKGDDRVSPSPEANPAPIRKTPPRRAAFGVVTTTDRMIEEGGAWASDLMARGEWPPWADVDPEEEY